MYYALCKYLPSFLQVYPTDLESVPDFNGFKEWLHTFELTRGKKTGDIEDDESRVVGKFKVSQRSNYSGSYQCHNPTVLWLNICELSGYSSSCIDTM